MSHDHTHPHHHHLAGPHPSAAVGLSLLRWSLAQRLAAAIALSAILGVAVIWSVS